MFNSFGELVLDMATDGYFESYDDVAVHALMLKDKPRVNAYKRALERANLVGKVVLDVGAGTGLLSLLAAKAGALRVYAIEASSMADLAEIIVRQNNLEGVVRVVKSRIEDTELPEQVDVIVSEWMGFHLLHEGMLDSVLVARDRFLKKGGLMLPRFARVFASPCDMTEWCAENLYVWEDIAGLDFSPLASLMVQSALSAPVITSLTADNIIAAPAMFGSIDCMTVCRRAAKHLGGLESEFVAKRMSMCHGFAVWFEVEFEGATDGEAQTVLSTSPFAEPTHWKQTVVFLPETLGPVAGSRLDAKIGLDADEENERHYWLSLSMGAETPDADGDEDDDV